MIVNITPFSFGEQNPLKRIHYHKEQNSSQNNIGLGKQDTHCILLIHNLLLCQMQGLQNSQYCLYHSLRYQFHASPVHRAKLKSLFCPFKEIWYR